MLSGTSVSKFREKLPAWQGYNNRLPWWLRWQVIPKRLCTCTELRDVILTQGTNQTQPLRDKSNTSCQLISYATHLQYLKWLIFAIFTAGKFRILAFLVTILCCISETVTRRLKTCNVKHFKRPCLQGKQFLTVDAGIQSQGSSGVIRGTKYEAG